MPTPPKPIRKAVFPAAGLGTRFLPATKAQPKEMLALVDKPIIQYGVEEALDSGIDEIVIITGRGKNSIEDHFDVSFELERMLEEKGKTDLLAVVREVSDMIHVAYVRQKEALGLGHAVLAAENLVGEEPFAVLLADDVIDAQVPVMRQMLDVYEATGASVVAVEKIAGEAISSYGVVKPAPATDRLRPDQFLGPVVRVADVMEKPRLAQAPSDLAVVGRYLLTPGIFKHLRRQQRGAGGEIQLTDAMRALAQEEPFYAYQFQGRRHDTGDKLGFLQATVELALKREDLGAAFRQYLHGLQL
ncbi:MAG: UTP--glucose-1-phosphate uridylyltransferase GalU [Acidobacteria bacterium]|nr:MAG: UTP--glucose-1-phosphate uridylyltransferase GalU [Acidobacteriota bacterium]